MLYEENFGISLAIINHGHFYIHKIKNINILFHIYMSSFDTALYEKII